MQATRATRQSSSAGVGVGVGTDAAVGTSTGVTSTGIANARVGSGIDSGEGPNPGGEGARDGCTCFRLRCLARLTGRRFDARMASVGLKTTQYSLLSALWRGGAMRATDLARVLALDASTLTRNVEPLIEAGWVEASPGRDRRTRVLHLTRSGLALRERGRRAWVGAQRDLERLLGERTVTTLHQLLDHCRTVLEAADDADDLNEPAVAPPARRSRSARTGTSR